MKNNSTENDGKSRACVGRDLKDQIDIIVEYLVASDDPCETVAEVVSELVCGAIAVEREAYRHLANGRP
jgi:hypothetical protein